MMKTTETTLYLTIISEYLNGQGIDFARHGFSKDGVKDFVSYVFRVMKPEIAQVIVMDVISQIL